MKAIKNIFLVLGILVTVSGCDYLDSEPEKKGTLEEGRMADVMLFDPECTYAIDKNKFWSKAKNTPFHGRKVTGKVMMTICDGKIVYDAAEE